MRVLPIFIMTLSVALMGFAETTAVAAETVWRPTQAVPSIRINTTRKTILTDFMSAISVQKYESALSMLLPKFSEAWTLEGFTRDWNEIRNQASSDWQPEIIGTFTGQSPQGPYEQVTYRLVSNWRSVSSLDLISSDVDGEPRIVRIHIRVPYSGNRPRRVEAQTDSFIASMLREEYGEVQTMFAPAVRQRFSPAALAQLKPILGNSPKSTSRSYYRFLANTVWYDTVRLSPLDDPATHLELVMESGTDPVVIASLSFKGRLQR